MWRTLLDFLFPRRSLSGVEGVWITEEERRHLASQPVILEGPALRRLRISHIDRIVAAADYRQTPLLQRAIHTFKYRGIRELQEELGQVLSQAMPLMILRDNPVVCPVPLHWSRRFARGFNQAELLGREVARLHGLTFLPALRRTRPTGSQVKRGREERFRAMIDAFRAIGPVPPSVIVVDDISTTGATLDMCAEALKKAGARFVQGLVVAHG